MRELVEAVMLLLEDEPKPGDSMQTVSAEPEKRYQTPAHTKAKKYHKHGGMPLTKVAKELGYSVGMVHWIEHEAFIKFAASLFNPPWQVQHRKLKGMKDAGGKPVKLVEVGQFYDDLAKVVTDKLTKGLGRDPDAEEFKQAYEDAIIETSLSVDFRGQMREMFVKHFLDKAEQKVKA